MAFKILYHRDALAELEAIELWCHISGSYEPGGTGLLINQKPERYADTRGSQTIRNTWPVYHVATYEALWEE